MPAQVEIDKANLVYARLVEVITTIGLALMVIGLILYVLGVMPAYVNLSTSIKHWNMLPEKFWETVKGFRPTNYNWIFANLEYGDILSVLGIVILPIGVMLALIGVASVYAKKKDVMSLIALVVLAIIASGHSWTLYRI